MFSSRLSQSRTNSRFRVALLSLISLLLVGCGSSAGSPSPSPSGAIIALGPTGSPTSTNSATTPILTSTPLVTASPAASVTSTQTPSPTPGDTATPPPGGCGNDATIIPAVSRLSSGPTPPATDILPGHFGATGTPLPNGGYDASSPLGNGQVLFLGGGAYGDRAEIYLPTGADSGDFVPTGNLLLGRRNPLTALLPNGKVLIVGGSPEFGCVASWLNEVEIYDPGSGPTDGHFISLNSASGGVNDPALSPLHGTDYTHLTRLSDGRILLSGGQSCDAAQDLCGPASEIYDSSVGQAGTFTPTAAAIPFGVGSMATLLPNGQVLFAGGEIDMATGPVASSAAGLYDPTNDTFASTGHMVSVRDGATAVALSNNGGVLISGGSDDFDSIVASAEIYNPATGTFSATAQPMSAPRLGHSATLLADGQQVLIVGGMTAFGDGTNDPVWLASAELYDLDAGTFSATGSMTVMRQSFTSNLLVGGTVLVVGGFTQDLANDSADLYQP